MGVISLNGDWNVSFATKGSTYDNKWYSICLPQTTEMAKLGQFSRDHEQMQHLSRNYPYTGKAYYKKEFCIDGEQNDEYILCLERTKFTEVYVDGEKKSESKETLIPQIHMLGKMENGIHELMICVDNNLESYHEFPKQLMSGHQYSDETQTNWNGILGDITISNYKSSYIKNQKVILDEETDIIAIQIDIVSEIDCVRQLKVYMTLTKENQPNENPNCDSIYSKTQEVVLKKGINTISIEYEDVMNIEFWDEFSPILYEFISSLENEVGQQICNPFVTRSGFRTAKSFDRYLLINDQRVFLRGNVDCCIYPRTGASPMSEEEWESNFLQVQSYGMNHIRFHSWCPPEAAFAVADRFGIYLQIEMPGFGIPFYEQSNELYDDVLNNYYYDQGRKILEQYGNHPSFLIFAIGNELNGDLSAYEKLIEYLRGIRDDKYFTQGANNFLQDPVVSTQDDIFVSMRTSKEENIRASYSHADLPLGHVQTTQDNGTSCNYMDEINHILVPIIAHEVGQYQVFPRMNEIEKYTGVLYSTALENIKERIRKAGLLHQVDDFVKASGALAVQCYREDIEANLRTNDMSGFQLLGLNDFSGQGSAYVGILDSFYEDKEIITKEEWKNFCNDQVILMEFSDYVYSTGEEFYADILCYNYGADDIDDDIEFVFWTKEANLISKQVRTQAKRGKLTKLGTISFMIPEFDEACEVTIDLKLGSIKNQYHIWVYPRKELEESGKVLVTNEFGKKEEDYLKEGGTVFYAGTKLKKGICGFFPTDFWCYHMFQESCIKNGKECAPGTMGLYIQNEHAALNGFPTNYFSEWQWRNLVNHSMGYILDGEEANIIVQVIDNFDRNHKLGLIYEQQVGKGHLICCGIDLLNMLEQPNARQLYQSLLAYCKTL